MWAYAAGATATKYRWSDGRASRTLSPHAPLVTSQHHWKGAVKTAASESAVAAVQKADSLAAAAAADATNMDAAAAATAAAAASAAAMAEAEQVAANAVAVRLFVFWPL